MAGVPIEVDLQAHGVGGCYADYLETDTDTEAERSALAMLRESCRQFIKAYDKAARGNG